MKTIHLKKGLDIPLAGEPVQEIDGEKQPGRVALVGPDYVGLKPRFEVAVGDRVKLGQSLFTDKKNPGVLYTSPGSGVVTGINRGERRAFLSIVIELEGEEEVVFDSYAEERLPSLERQAVIDLLTESGLWNSLRARPFGKVPDPGKIPRSIFVTVIDTDPHAPDVAKTLQGRESDFINGLTVLSLLTEGKVFLCLPAESTLPFPENGKIEPVQFTGPHPAGNPGTHIHLLDPVGKDREVWHINAQDTAAIGVLITTGRIDVHRIISLAGPSVNKPRLVKTRLGAALDELVSEELREGGEGNPGVHRIVSGSVLSGRWVNDPTAYLGRYHQQVSVLPEGGKLTRLGPLRAIVPIGRYERVIPLDVLPTFLLRALAVNDVEDAENLGCLELVEEDLALCSYVCPSQIEHGTNLRRTLDIIEKEG